METYLRTYPRILTIYPTLNPRFRYWAHIQAKRIEYTSLCIQTWLITSNPKPVSTIQPWLITPNSETAYPTLTPIPESWNIIPPWLLFPNPEILSHLDSYTRIQKPYPTLTPIPESWNLIPPWLLFPNSKNQIWIKFNS